MSVTARQSTARTVMVGPVLDADGVAVTGAVVGDFKISKNGGAPAALNGSATLTHRHTGHYSLALTASDTDTVGSAQITLDKTTDTCPEKDLTVVEEAVYDAIWVASATGKLPATLATADVSGNLPANVLQFGSSNGTFSGGRPEVNTSHIAGSAISQSGGVANVNVAQLSGDSTAADNAEAFFDGTGYAGTGNVIPTVTTLTNAPPDSAGVTTLLSRIPAALFSGITSLAQWLGLIAGKQTGNTTARNELRATGAGSGTFDETVDSLEALRDRGDAAWVTASGFSTHSAADVWANGTRTLTAGTNISLAKGTGVTGFNDLSAAQVNAEVDTALADYDGLVPADLPSNFAALGINASGHVSRVTLVDTTTTNTDMRGTDSAALASVCTEGRLAELDAANLPADVDQIKADLPARITKNTELAAFPFKMVDSTDHVTAETGVTVTATRSLDGAAFGACANAVSEIGSGWYKITLAAADTNANTIILKFTATGCDTTEVVLVTQST